MINSSFRSKFFGKKSSSAPHIDTTDNIDINTLESNLEISNFLLACEQGDISTLRSILVKYENNIHINNKQENKENNKHLEFLLNYKDPNTNKTGLIYACISGHIDIVDELIKQGVNIEKCHDGSTPLYHATSRGHINVVKILLNYKANVNAINNKGWTCLMNAAYFGRDDIVKLLLEHNANPDIIRNEFDGKCALHFASKNGRYKVVELLLDYGADPNICDKCDGRTALMYSASHGYQQILLLLLLYGSDPMILNTHNKKAIDFIEYNDDEHSDYEHDEFNDNQHKEIKLQQKNLYLLMKNSDIIYESIHKLVNTNCMRLILGNMNKLNNYYPLIKYKINNISHISELYNINEIDINKFNDLCINDISKNMNDLKVVYCNNSPADGDINNEYEHILSVFKDKVLISRQECNIGSENVLRNECGIKIIESQIIDKTKNINELMAQISMLTRQLQQCENDKIYLSKKLEKQQLNRNYLRDNLINVSEKMKIDNILFELMTKATNNIKSVSDKAYTLPNKYKHDLQYIYENKRKQLELNWKYWNLNDIISWISNLDLNGKFKKYSNNLQKLCELEDYHLEDDEHDIINIQIYDSNEEEDDIEGNTMNINDIETDINNMLPDLVTPDDDIDSKEYELRTPILQLINDTVLKMCGIKNTSDRKIIMMHINSLINGENNINYNDENKSDDEDMFAFDEGDIDELTNHIINEQDIIQSDIDDENELKINEDINSKFLCPISKCIMRDPVICSDGFSYQRQAIEKWLENNNISPVTKQQLSTKQLFTNQNLKSMIHDTHK